MGWRLRRTRLSSRNASMRERPRRDKQKKPAQLFHAIHPYTSLSEAAFKKNGEPFQAPRRGGGVSSSLLERESQPKCEQPHRRVSIEARYLAGTPRLSREGARAVDTRIALGVVEAHDWVVEDVVGVHTEFRPVTLRNSEILREREIRRKKVRSAERVVPDVSECTRRRAREHASRVAILSERGNRREPSYNTRGRISMDTRRK